MTILDRLAAEGIHIRTGGSTYGDFRSTCPHCSRSRKRKPKQKCLSIKLEGDKAVWWCFHCNAKGAINADTKGDSVSRKQGARSRTPNKVWRSKFDRF